MELNKRVRFIDRTNPNIYGRNVEAVTPCYWFFGGFRNRKVDPVRVKY